MTIIKHGFHKGNTVRFLCPCGCMFDAEDTEYKVLKLDGECPINFYQVNCPECNALITIDGAKATFERYPGC